MNYLKILVLFPFIFLASCNDDNGGDGCLSPEEIAGSSCPASDLLLVCDPFFCGGSTPPDGDDEGVVFDFFLPPTDIECTVIDCTTLDCGIAGIFSELEINQFGYPSGMMSNPDGSQSFFSSCTVFQ
ncbi:MAG: hypothetical protein KJ002_14065 [Candidatus Dadabacteria bacterium]|nr:hypothetical protein [Candidatus Dadabacteria bacterium]